MNASSAGPRAVVFDLDGTLIDSMPFVLKAFAHALAPFRPELTEDDIFLRLGGPPERTLAGLLGDPAKTAEALRRLDAFGFSGGDLPRPFPGMAAMLAALRERGLRLAIWTGRDRATTEAILRGHDLARHFPVVVCGDDLGTHKPDPEGLREILRRLSVAAGEALFVGDADADVLGGHGAGVRTLFIGHGREPSPEVAARAWRVADTPGEAYDIVLAGTASSGAPARGEVDAFRQV